jgi:hypothetical protein
MFTYTGDPHSRRTGDVLGTLRGAATTASRGPAANHSREH